MINSLFLFTRKRIPVTQVALSIQQNWDWNVLKISEKQNFKRKF